MSKRAYSLLLIATCTVACGPAVTISRDPLLPIAPGATYAWGLADGARGAAERDPKFEADSVRRRIERAVDDELAARGFHKIAFADAQLIVHYHVGAQHMVDTVRTATPCGGRPCGDPQMEWGYWGAPEAYAREEPYTQGTLMLDFLARPSLKVAWRGTIVGEVTAKSSSDASIRKGVARLLKDFPGS
ncbi:MAG: DUF4136 domain-containing protein [Gemmatimonadetes bacterium]|nr:DUF4136 domain-containing protein [Gemmatimonadota bacterium]